MHSFSKRQRQIVFATPAARATNRYPRTIPHSACTSMLAASDSCANHGCIATQRRIPWPRLTRSTQARVPSSHCALHAPIVTPLRFRHIHITRHNLWNSGPVMNQEHARRRTGGLVMHHNHASATTRALALGRFLASTSASASTLGHLFTWTSMSSSVPSQSVFGALPFCLPSRVF